MDRFAKYPHSKLVEALQGKKEIEI